MGGSELGLLAIRLQELRSVVDVMVVGESRYNHRGDRKRLWQGSRLGGFLARAGSKNPSWAQLGVEHIVAEDGRAEPCRKYLDRIYELRNRSVTQRQQNEWVAQNLQRECLWHELPWLLFDWARD